MARDLNSVAVTGNLTRDPNVKALPSGTFVAEFSIACNGYAKNIGPTVDYFDITVFGKVAEIVSEYLGKGSSVAITGRLKQDRWEGESGKRSRIKIIADTIKFFGGNGGHAEEPEDEDEPF